MPPREPKYEIILDEEEQQEQEEEREKSNQEKRLSKKERRKKKKYRLVVFVCLLYWFVCCIYVQKGFQRRRELNMVAKECLLKGIFRQNKFTLPEGGHGGSQHDNGQDPSSHFPGESL